MFQNTEPTEKKQDSTGNKDPHETTDEGRKHNQLTFLI